MIEKILFGAASFFTLSSLAGFIVQNQFEENNENNSEIITVRGEFKKDEIIKNQQELKEERDEIEILIENYYKKISFYYNYFFYFCLLTVIIRLAILKFLYYRKEKLKLKYIDFQNVNVDEYNEETSKLSNSIDKEENVEKIFYFFFKITKYFSLFLFIGDLIFLLTCYIIGVFLFGRAGKNFFYLDNNIGMKIFFNLISAFFFFFPFNYKIIGIKLDQNKISSNPQKKEETSFLAPDTY